MSWSADRFSTIQLSKINWAHSSATFQVRKHTFKASVACNGREVLRGTPNAPKKLCFEGKPRSRRRAHERSEVAARSREGGTAFRRVRPPIALAITSRQPLTGAPNECRLKGGTRKHLSPSAMRSEPVGRIPGAEVSLRLARITCPLIYSEQNRGCVNQKSECAPP